MLFALLYLTNQPARRRQRTTLVRRALMRRRTSSIRRGGTGTPFRVSSKRFRASSSRVFIRLPSNKVQRGRHHPAQCPGLATDPIPSLERPSQSLLRSVLGDMSVATASVRPCTRREPLS